MGMAGVVRGSGVKRREVQARKGELDLSCHPHSPCLPIAALVGNPSSQTVLA
jgi:hypothetical protein